MKIDNLQLLDEHARRAGVKGGQGRSDAETYDSAWITLVAFLGIIGVLGALGIYHLILLFLS